VSDKVYVQPGQRVRVMLPHNPICIRLQLAGKPMEVELQPTSYGWAYVQLCGAGRELAITPGEAGFHHDEHGFYCYAACLQPGEASSTA